MRGRKLYISGRKLTLSDMRRSYRRFIVKGPKNLYKHWVYLDKMGKYQRKRKWQDRIGNSFMVADKVARRMHGVHGLVYTSIHTKTREFVHKSIRVIFKIRYHARKNSLSPKA